MVPWMGRLGVIDLMQLVLFADVVILVGLLPVTLVLGTGLCVDGVGVDGRGESGGSGKERLDGH